MTGRILKGIPGDGQATNPFATDHVRPGAIAFVGDDGPEADDGDGVLSTIERDLAAAGGVGVILGPHGSGKTTLLVHLVRRAEAAGRPARLVRFECASGRRSSAERWPVPRRGERLAIDAGGDRSPPARHHLAWKLRRLGRSVRAAGGELFVAAHDDPGIPIVHRRCVSASVAIGVIRTLLDRAGHAAASSPSVPEICGALSRHDGNLREVLFECYDRWERGWEAVPRLTPGRSPGLAPGLADAVIGSSSIRTGACSRCDPTASPAGE